MSKPRHRYTVRGWKMAQGGGWVSQQQRRRRKKERKVAERKANHPIRRLIRTILQFYSWNPTNH